VIEDIEGFIAAVVRIGTHVGDLRYFRVLPRIGESVEHRSDVDPRGTRDSYRVVDVWHWAWHPTKTELMDDVPTIVLEDPRHSGELRPEVEPQVLRLHPDDIELLAERIAEELKRP
jgi:hypothetical protein